MSNTIVSLPYKEASPTPPTPTKGNIEVKFIYIDQTTGEQVVEKKYCEKGDSVSRPIVGHTEAINGVMPAMEFEGWNDGGFGLISNVQNDMTIGAMYTPKKITVEYQDWSSTISPTMLLINVTKASNTSHMFKFEYSGAEGRAFMIVLNDDFTTNYLMQNPIRDLVSGNNVIELTFPKIGLYWVVIGLNGSTSREVPITLGSTNGGNVVSSFAGLTKVICGMNTKVGRECFSLCRSLYVYTMPNGYLYLSQGMLNGCSSLESISIPIDTSRTKIENNTFKGCSLLKNVSTTSFIKTIGSGALSDCVSLKEFATNEVTSIEDDAFSNCSSLERLAISYVVNSMGEEVIFGCYALSIIDMTNAKSIPSYELIISSYSPSALFKIVVPDNLYDMWIANEKWSYLAKYIYKQSSVVM